MLEILIFILGAIIGSFLNVCIHRIPRHESIVKPGSHCPACMKPVRAYDNIPVVSYFVLRGKCRSCKSLIPVRYPIIEILAGLLTLAAYWKFGISGEFLFYTVFIYFLFVVGFIDLETQLILNKTILHMLGIGMAMNLGLNVISWTDAMIGLAAGGGIMFFFAMLGSAIFRKESLGMGDIKFAAAAGFYLGWKLILFALFFGFVAAFIFMIALMVMGKIRRGSYLPLGPFLAISLTGFVYWGVPFVQWYWEFFASAGS